MRLRFWRTNGVLHANGHNGNGHPVAGSSEPWLLHKCPDCQHMGLVVYPTGAVDCCELAAGELHACYHVCPWSVRQAPHLPEGHRCRADKMPVHAGSDPFSPDLFA